MNISSFEELLHAAHHQQQPQCMLFVFTKAELPEDATPEEAERFAKGQGGALAPVMFVDKLARDVRSFADLVKESQQTGKDWDVAFVGCLDGRGGEPPGEEETQQALELMVKSIQGGIVTRYLAYRPNGEQLRF